MKRSNRGTLIEVGNERHAGKDMTAGRDGAKRVIGHEGSKMIADRNRVVQTAKRETDPAD